MFGTNPIRKIDLGGDDGCLAVQEIFYTLQGEGPLAGWPAVFIRLAGCHLACTFCDTEFESGINNRLTVEAISEQAWAPVPAACEPIAVLTGGEPMRQRLAPLVHYLITKAGFWLVQIETAGNFWEPELEYYINTGQLVIVCSPKTAHVHKEIARNCRHWKYVVRWGWTGLDGLPTTPTQANGEQPPWNFNYHAPTLPRPRSADTVWISPCDDHDPEQNARNVKQAVHICLKQGYRLSLQTHKLVGLP